jgi:opine dehydrogenase
MKISIFGAGNCGALAAVYFSGRACDVLCYTRNPAKHGSFQNIPLAVSGALNGVYRLKATMDIHEALDFGGLLLICVSGLAHRELLSALRGGFKKGQKLLILNSNFGAYKARAILGGEIRDKGLAVGETASQPFLAALEGFDRLTVRAVKESLSLAGLDPEQGRELRDCLAPYYKQVRLMDSVIETSLSGANPLIHTTLTMFNIARIENGEEFHFLRDAPSGALGYIDRLDRERRAVGSALNISPLPLLEEMRSFWPERYESLGEMFRSNPSYAANTGPRTLNHRFVTEDIPFGLMPINSLGRLAGVDTPYSLALEQCLCLYLNNQFEKDRIKFDPALVQELCEPGAKGGISC